MAVLSRLAKDAAFTARMAGLLRKIIPLARNPARIFPDEMEMLAAKFGERPALTSDRETLTYAGLDRRANRYARWAKAHGVGKGDTVCLLMPNRPEFVAVWLGVARAGGVTALLNTNLAGMALAYSINIVKAKHVIVAAELADQFATAEELVAPETEIWLHGGTGGRRVDMFVDDIDDSPIPKDERPKLIHDDPCLYIYTSGTTGLPKAAKINHYRVLGAMLAFSVFMGARRDDRMYDCLPLYHTVGGVIAAGAPLMVGASVFIREKFSATQFWHDVVEQKCTLVQYVGELCRYLLNAPDHPKAGAHRIRTMCGNGLRPDVWEPFQKRFSIPHIREFYAATEGNALLFNLDETPGAIGRCPWWTSSIFPMAVVAFDIEKEEAIRGPDGFCVRVPDGEIGELISLIVFDAMKPGQRFDGYADREASERKIMHDVFEKGDRWFRSGDLVRRDKDGYFHFVDRVGDTFRWKGENVSTAEVAETIDVIDGVAETTVYGVAISSADGRAGMAAIVPGDGFDLVRLRAEIHARLPVFARPRFVRLRAAIDHTSTFKQQKLDLIREGFDPDSVADPLYFDDHRTGTYVPLTVELCAAIHAGDVRL